MNLFEQRTHEMCAKIGRMLELPPIPGGDELYCDGECFAPWELFPCVFGTYGRAFDDMAIAVLEDALHSTFKRTDLAAEMFREMLCVAALCEYGTSPRTCFATQEFKRLLPHLIERWIEYQGLCWGVRA